MIHLNFNTYKIFLFLKVNYAAANKACCAFGMSLAIFKTKAEQTCMTDYTKSKISFAALCME
jgi:hypothetical protein